MTVTREAFGLLPPAARATIISVALLAGGCSISDTVHVRNGVTPQLADDNVRFRTTYYFRSVDFCEPDDPAEESNFTFDGRLPASSDQVFVRKKRIRRVLKDTLYRFTMTGKASPLSKVRFESGTLKSWQIDPFGASAAFDKQNNRFYWKSQESTQADARTAEIIDDVKQLTELRSSMAETNPAGAGAIDGLIISRLTTLSSTYGPENTLHLAQAIAASLHKISADSVTAVKDKAEGLGVDTEAPTATPEEVDPVAQKGAVIASFNSQIGEVEKEVAWLKTLNEAAKKKAEEAATALLDEVEKVAKPADGEPPLPRAAPVIGVRAEPLAAKISDLAGQHADVKTAQEAAKPPLKEFDETNAALSRAESARDSLKRYLGRLEGMALSSTGAVDSGECSASSRFGRGFQLIGPEGVRTFDQEDRLIMAMSSSPQPILGALQELSGRMLKNQAGTSERLLPLVQEQLRINQARQALPAIEARQPGDLKSAIEALAKKLDEGDAP